MALTKMFHIPSFLGLHECADGDTQIQMGEAADMVNFAVTHDGNLKLRPGLALYKSFPAGTTVLAHYSGQLIDEVPYLVLFLEIPEPDPSCGSDVTHKAIFMRQPDGTSIPSYQEVSFSKYFPTTGIKINPIPCSTEEGPGLIALVNGDVPMFLTFINAADFDFYCSEAEPYVPVVITGASPSGGGTELENINLMSPNRRIRYSADGESVDFTLPDEAVKVRYVYVDNVQQTGNWSFTQSSHNLRLNSAPAKGVNNVEVEYAAGDPWGPGARQIASQPYYALYNGATDSRVFLYGSGNKCYYSGVTEAGKATPLYFPAMNEIEVGMDSGPITAMVRHGGRLMAFKSGGAYSITYSPVTMEDGRVIAGFYLRPQHMAIGNQPMGQVSVVKNCPRTICGGRIYDWRIYSNSTRDEQSARDVSGRVFETMSAADPGRVTVYDDDQDQTWYCFLNDEEGTTIVHRYDLDVWFKYKSSFLSGVKFACRFDNAMMVITDSGIMKFDQSLSEDLGTGQIKALWESGFMDFGASYMRKSASYIWLSMLPEKASRMTVTAQTDKKNSYTEKTVGSNVLFWDMVDYRNFSYNLFTNPRPKRIKLKVKKFVYYKLIFRVDSPGARATVLGVDQQIQYSSMAK